MANRWRNSRNSGWLYFFWAPKSLQMATTAMKLKDAYPWKKSCDQHRQYMKRQRYYFANKDPSSQGYGFSSGHVWMWELNYKENWALKNWSFWTVVLEKSHIDILTDNLAQWPSGSESPWMCKWGKPSDFNSIDILWQFYERAQVNTSFPTFLKFWPTKFWT